MGAVRGLQRGDGDALADECEDLVSQLHAVVASHVGRPGDGHGRELQVCGEREARSRSGGARGGEGVAAGARRCQKPPASNAAWRR